MKSFKTLPLLALAVMITACGLIVGDPGETSPEVATTTTVARSCVQVTLGTEPIDTGSPATDAISLSGEIFRCAQDVVVVGETNLNEIVAAAQLAAALNGPLLFPHPRLAAELGRLEPTTVHVVGNLEINTPPDTAVEAHDISTALLAAGEALNTTRTVDIAASPDSSSITETVSAIAAGDRVARPPADATGAMGSGIDTAELVAALAEAGGSGPVWLVDGADPVTILLSAAVAHAVGAVVVATDLDDLFRYPEVGPALDGYPDRPLRLVGATTVLNDWHLRTLINGQQIPGGGFELFPDHIPRRFVAFYGHPRSETLGAMGQVTPEQALALMRDGGFLNGYSPSRCLPSPCRGTVPAGLLEDFGADGSHVVPTFNYIASVAHPQCRSSLTSIEVLQEGVDVAAANGGYVMLDLQPGSDRFIEHAHFYEELLRLPHVGLAIDPEWRCGWPGQTEFNKVGTVTAAEINEVIEWLADLVNEAGLPQKLLLIQQFRLDMIQNRDQLIQRPEIQVVIQMDGEGQGTLSAKDSSWRGVTSDTQDNHWMWGWKNFFVRDHPDGPMSPADTLNRDPVPVYISYQ